MKTFLKAGVAALALALPLAAQAEYPEKPVEFVVPWPPGDLEDVLTRMIAEQFQETYGVPAAVVNKPGGGGGPFPGAAEVAGADPDGYTVGSFVIGVPLVGPETGIPALNPNPFEPVGIFLTYPFVIAASGDAPYSTMEELADYAQDNDVALGHFGSFLIPTQVTFALSQEMGFDYAAEAAFDALDCNTLASGDVDVINTTLQLIKPCLDDLNVLASIGAERTALTPDSRTVGEIAPSLDISLWNGLFVHKDTPADVREKIAAVAAEVVMSDAAQKLASETGALIYWQDAEAATAQIEKDAVTLGTVAELIGD
ncbi:exported protein [Mameliella alba]|jgi:tripartite-type tricarboxylate transporter receptor subunit TctC|uniref:Transporter n=1 Tax=Mameliella alba TaxID=561184 RepID=A0A0B3RT60_9RHOB|nr:MULTISPECIES: tripartite tricarboxylate transporter substrate-binding protein [Mameliella]MCR9274701.1 tripartite tricarboxylate transporter substrate-binding protein [Paracoccaceae bacterium]ODM46623.1 transporter [Ruegeria sp. PBVC088]KHQ49913.1 Transporter [Mameliella alba]MDD9732749.1 tripartite tricarboxylate transporter substrate-binding protein [Mameliella sp. AT18]OWV46583.1 transporter [Mameliella alba]